MASSIEGRNPDETQVATALDYDREIAPTRAAVVPPSPAPAEKLTDIATTFGNTAVNQDSYHRSKTLQVNFGFKISGTRSSIPIEND